MPEEEMIIRKEADLSHSHPGELLIVVQLTHTALGLQEMNIIMKTKFVFICMFECVV